VALINGIIPSLINGVSQQPPTLRLPSQCELQENAYSSAADGVGKRAPTEHIARILNESTDWPKVHWIDRDENEQYAVVVEGSRPRVYDLKTGFRYKVVSTLYEYNYLRCNQPSHDLVALTVADTTFFLNKTKNVAMMPETTPNRLYEALVWIRQGSYAQTYTVKVNGKTFTHVTSDDDGDDIRTNVIADKLARMIRSGLSDANFRVRHRAEDSTIWIYHPEGDEFTIEVSDSNANQMVGLVTKTAQRFDDLPSIAPNDFRVKITGDVESDADDYWVQFATDGGVEFGPGVWRETAAEGIPFMLDPTTMPHLLVREQDDAAGNETGVPFGVYFRFKKATWEHREVGDERTNPDPSFVGSSINDIFLHRNRLGLLTKDHVVFSRAGDFFNFWRGTSQTILDDDPIDVSSAHPNVIALRHAVPFNEELLLFGEQSQLVLRAGDTLTPKTVGIFASTEYMADPACEPVATENLVFFPYRVHGFAGVREMFADNNGRKDARNITSHIPRYIPGSLFSMTASTTEATLIGLSDEDRRAMYVYRWLWNGEEKLQSSWSRWRIGSNATILGVRFIGSTLYLVVRRSCGQYLEKMVLDRRADDDANYVTHLDRRITEDQTKVSYNALTNRTTFTLPYKPDDTPVVVTRADTSDWAWKPGVLHEVERVVDCGEPPPPPVLPDPDPVISIIAIIPDAYEETESPGRFALIREGGDFSQPLNVQVAFSGTAVRDTDYTTSIPANVVTITANMRAATFDVIPIDDALEEGDETVTCMIVASPGYRVAFPGSAVVTIHESESTPEPECPPDETTAYIAHFSGVELLPTCFSGVNRNVGVGSYASVYGDVEMPSDYPVPFDPILGNGEREDTNIMWLSLPGSCDGSVGGGSFDAGFRVAIQRVGSEYRLVAFIHVHPNTYYFFDGTSDCIIGPYENTVVLDPDALGYVGLAQGGTAYLTPNAGTPTNLSGSLQDGVNVSLTWTVQPDAYLVILRIATGNGGYETIAQVGPDDKPFLVTGLNPGTTYHFQAIAMTPAGTLQPSNVVTLVTHGMEPPPIPIPPDQPPSPAPPPPPVNIDGVAVFNTGQDVQASVDMGIDTRWTINDQPAKLYHPHYTSDYALMPQDSPATWIGLPQCYNADPAGGNYDFKTTVRFGQDVNPSDFNLDGFYSCDDTLVNVYVNGAAAGIVNNASGLRTSLHTFSLPGSMFRRGLNEVTFRINNLSGPTALMVVWELSADAEVQYVGSNQVVFPVQGGYVRTPEPEAIELVRVEMEGMPVVERDRDELTAVLADKPRAAAKQDCDCDHKIVVEGDFRGRKVYIGNLYEMRYRLSQPQIRRPTDFGGIAALTGGSLLLRTIKVNHSATGYYRLEITPRYRDTVKAPFTARTVSVPVTRIGYVPLDTGQHRSMVRARNDEVDIDLVNDSFLPCWLVSADWEGTYHSRSRPI
jgi:hypothetical protein